LALLLLLPISAFARDKNPYRTTKLIELQSTGTGFCFIVQIDDLAHIGVSNDAPTSNLIVADKVQVKVTGQAIHIMTNKKWPDVEPDGAIKARIAVQQRMTRGSKLPTCAFPVSVH